MPIYEYACQACGARFETLVRSFGASADAECPHCHSMNCRKSISLFSSVSSGSRTGAGGDCAPSGG